jgi:hypothetical protein
MKQVKCDICEETFAKGCGIVPQTVTLKLSAASEGQSESSAEMDICPKCLKESTCNHARHLLAKLVTELKKT